MNNKVLAIDPGRTSGIIIAPTPLQFYYMQVDTFYAMNIIEREAPCRIVMEKFVLQRRPHVDIFPVELIGCIHRYVISNPTELTEQMPANIVGIQPELIKRMGLWIPSQPHAMDALRHLIYYYLSLHAPLGSQLIIRDVIAGKQHAEIKRWE